MKYSANLKVKEVTPPQHVCGVGVCPSLFEVEGSDSYLVIGKKLSESEIPEEVKKKIGPDEMVVSVPREIIDDFNRK